MFAFPECIRTQLIIDYVKAEKPVRRNWWISTINSLTDVVHPKDITKKISDERVAVIFEGDTADNLLRISLDDSAESYDSDEDTSAEAQGLLDYHNLGVTVDVPLRYREPSNTERFVSWVWDSLVSNSSATPKDLPRNAIPEHFINFKDISEEDFASTYVRPSTGIVRKPLENSLKGNIWSLSLSLGVTSYSCAHTKAKGSTYSPKTVCQEKHIPLRVS